MAYNKKTIETKSRNAHQHKKSADRNKKSKFPGKIADVLRRASIIVIVFLLAFVHFRHQSTMFENDRHFSHLSTLEREMTFRTEMGLYYSYFKSMIEARSFTEGLDFLLSDTRVEYPSKVNTIRKFNVYPELIIGFTYRTFMEVSNKLNIQVRFCWQVSRGGDLDPVISCEGWGDPAIFYTNMVFLWNAVVPSLLFLYGYYISDSLLGGVISAACFFFNHGECTRVQWTPPLRESFGYPIFLAQMLSVSFLINQQRQTLRSKVFLGILNCMFILTWQFAQFALLTQFIVVTAMYLMKIVRPVTAHSIVHVHLISLIVSIVLLFGNSMLIASVYFSCLLSTLCVLHFHKYILKIASNVPRFTKTARIFLQISLMSFTFVIIKLCVKFIFVTRDDAHIFNILRSKFTNYKDFHTLLYTCAAEFDFLPVSTLFDLCQTLLLPSAVVAAFTVAVKVLRIYFGLQEKEPLDSKIKSHIYNIGQLLLFAAMAALTMRLKLFFTPHLCVVASLVACDSLFRFIKSHQHAAFVILLISCMTIKGTKNINAQRDIVGEYSNPELEEMITWISSYTPQNAVFAGPMPTMANVMLSTRRAIVNHPHYEDAQLRERTKKVYTLYSRKPPGVVKRFLKELNVTYAVIGRPWCVTNEHGCGLIDIWDVVDPTNKHREPFCLTLQRDPSLSAKIVFVNDQYLIFKN